MCIHTITTHQSVSGEIFEKALVECVYYAHEHSLKMIPDPITETIQIQPDKTEIFDDIGKHNTIKVERKKWTLCLTDSGIDISLVRIIGWGRTHIVFSKYHIYYKLNLARTLGAGFVDTFNPNLLTAIVYAIDDKLKEISGSLPRFCDKNLQRIDFCQNIFLENEDHISAYIAVHKKAFHSKCFKMKRFRDDAGRIYDPDNSATFKQGNVAVVLYDKFSQMSSKSAYFPAEDIDKAKGLLRLEIQIEKSKIDYTCAVDNVRNSIQFLSEANKYAERFFNYYFPKLFCKGSFYSYSVAMSIIGLSGYKDRAKQEMKQIVRFASEKGSLSNAIKALKDCEFKQSRIDNLLDKFDELGLNPVTIPRRWDIEYLPPIIQNIHW